MATRALRKKFPMAAVHPPVLRVGAPHGCIQADDRIHSGRLARPPPACQPARNTYSDGVFQHCQSRPQFALCERATRHPCAKPCLCEVTGTAHPRNFTMHAARSTTPQHQSTAASRTCPAEERPLTQRPPKCRGPCPCLLHGRPMRTMRLPSAPLSFLFLTLSRFSGTFERHLLWLAPLFRNTPLMVRWLNGECAPSIIIASLKNEPSLRPIHELF